jgi:broad specificity phosphatase PhoE
LAGLNEIAEVEPDLAEWDYGDYEGQRPVDFARHGLTGMSFETDVRAVNRRPKFPNAQIG